MRPRYSSSQALNLKHRLPLSALLSHALVAFTIECDNEFEHRMPHRTTNYGATPGAPITPWLCSMVMWSNCMQFIPQGGIKVRELYRSTRVTKKNLRTMIVGLRRWGYLRLHAEASTSEARDSDRTITLTAAGLLARDIWRPLPDLIERRWLERFGRPQISALRSALWQAIQEFDFALPNFLPILGYGLFTNVPHLPLARNTSKKPDDLPLSALLSKVLLTFAVEYEKSGEVSLAIAADLLRLLGKKAVLVRDLPHVAAISKEAVAMGLGFLVRTGYASVETNSDRSRIVRLTKNGLSEQAKYHRLVWSIEGNWQRRFGEKIVHSLRNSLEQLSQWPEEPSRLLSCVVPYPDGWRSKVPTVRGLPDYPMVLHRGGFPDGS